jgi:hypothetical protein
MRVVPSLLLILLLLIPQAVPHHHQRVKGRASAPVQIGSAASVQGGIRIHSEQLRTLLQTGPTRAEKQSGEFSENGDQRYSRLPTAVKPPPVKRSPPMPDPISPLPTINWQATTGAAAGPAATGSPPDPQIAVSSTHVVIGMNNGLFFYKKDGKPYPSYNNFISTKSLFQPIINSGNLSALENGKIDSFSDLRLIFDPYRKRFWAIATGAYRSTVCQIFNPLTGKCLKCQADCNNVCLKGAFTLSNPAQRRSIIALAVSDDEDPAGIWYLYWGMRLQAGEQIIHHISRETSPIILHSELMLLL